MAGGMGRRTGPTLADRLAASGERGPAAPAPDGGPEASRDRPVVVRHCWVSGLPDAPGRHPGLLAEWRHDQDHGQDGGQDGGQEHGQGNGQGGGRWLGRVVYAVDEHGRVVLVERWLPAAHLTPA